MKIWDGRKVGNGGRGLTLQILGWDALYPRQSAKESRSKGAESRLERKKEGSKHKQALS
jgi:hypothetical protein